MYSKRPYLVPGGAQCGHNVVFGFPNIDFLLAKTLGRLRRYQVRVYEHQDAKPFHNAIHLRRDGPNNACMVLAVNSPVNSMRNFRSGPIARKLSSRQRWIMSSNTASKLRRYSLVPSATT